MFYEIQDCIDAGSEYCPCLIKPRHFGRMWRKGNHFFLSPVANITFRMLLSPSHKTLSTTVFKRVRFN